MSQKFDVTIHYRWAPEKATQKRTLTYSGESLEQIARDTRAAYESMGAIVYQVESMPSRQVVEFTDYDIDGIDHSDYPDFCDAFICGATAVLANGDTREATDAELDQLNDDGDLVHKLVYERLY